MNSFYSVEVYDPAKDKWEEGTPLTSGRSGHASAVIYQPSCANLYMECMEEQMNRSKKPPNADEDESRRGPSTSKNASQSSASSGVLHAFSGNRCNHCDETNKAEEQAEEEEQRKRKKEREDQSKYEIQCRNAIHCLLRMDCEEKPPDENSNMVADNDQTMDIPNENDNDDADDEETDEYFMDDFNSNKYRRKMSFESEESSTMSENSSSLDSFNSTNLRNRLKSRNDFGQCSLSRLKRKVRKNISDFVAWSSSSMSNGHGADDEAIAGPSNETNASNNVRKCDLLRKYYKCKSKT